MSVRTHDRERTVKTQNQNVMNIEMLQTVANRPLFIDFDHYTDGDADFKKELIYLMIENLQEVQNSLREAIEKNKLEIFEKTCHKIKPTISMLEDKDLIESIQIIRSQFSNKEQQEERTNAFSLICNQIIKSLEKETNYN